ncbi:BA14K family protein [Bradyrhizobium sp. SYSU BS000235]|uniref:BA14K family protein n=1 Tax=Bradyrhizobium sp. SYSU BS000235 TaxID=3411332 RepID=UPI003C734B20
MRTARRLAVTMLIGSMTLVSSLPAISAPLMTNAGLSKVTSSSDVTNVQYRRWHGRGHYHGGGGGGAAGLGIGLAAGAIIGGAIAASAAQANQNAAYCAQRYRSYDPRSGTYLSTDGNRYPCP